MELVTLWFFLIVVSASLSATYIFKQGYCVVMCGRRERPVNIGSKNDQRGSVQWTIAKL